MFGSKARADARYAFDMRFNRILQRIEALESAPLPETPPPPTLSPDDVVLLAMRDRLHDLETFQADQDRKQKELTFAVEEGIERVGRTERRIQATVARARKELREHDLADPGLEAEAAELRIVDGNRSETGGVPPVPAEVAEPDEAPSSIRGVPASTLQRVRGL